MRLSFAALALMTGIAAAASVFPFGAYPTTLPTTSQGSSLGTASAMVVTLDRYVENQHWGVLSELQRRPPPDRRAVELARVICASSFTLPPPFPFLPFCRSPASLGTSVFDGRLSCGLR